MGVHRFRPIILTEFALSTANSKNSPLIFTKRKFLNTGGTALFIALLCQQYRNDSKTDPMNLESSRVSLFFLGCWLKESVYPVDFFFVPTTSNLKEK